MQLGKLAVDGIHRPKTEKDRNTNCSIVFQICKYVNLACFLYICKPYYGIFMLSQKLAYCNFKYIFLEDRLTMYMAEIHERYDRFISIVFLKPLVWWKSISGHSSDVTERWCVCVLWWCGLHLQTRDYIIVCIWRLAVICCWLLSFFCSPFVCSTSLCQTRKKSFIMSRWLEVSIGENTCTRFITSEEMDILQLHGFISLGCERDPQYFQSQGL